MAFTRNDDYVTALVMAFIKCRQCRNHTKGSKGYIMLGNHCTTKKMPSGNNSGYELDNPCTLFTSFLDVSHIYKINAK